MDMPPDPFSTQDSTQVGNNLGTEPLLQIKADNYGVTTVTTLLKTVNFCEKVNLFVTMEGIRFVVEEGKYVQAGLFLKAELFKTFIVRKDAFGFKIPFKELLDCLKILGGDAKGGGSATTLSDASDGTLAGGAAASTRSMQITYHGYGTPFRLALEEQNMTTEVELKTEEVDDLIDFDEVDKKWEMTLDAKLLHEHLFELEGYAPEHVTLRVVPDTCLELRASGSAGSLKISIPKNCTGIERFCSVREEHHCHYKFTILRHSFKLIQAADKVQLQMGEMDVLCLRLVFKESMGTFGEFFVMPLADGDVEDFDQSFMNVDGGAVDR